MGSEGLGETCSQLESKGMAGGRQTESVVLRQGKRGGRAWKSWCKVASDNMNPSDACLGTNLAYDAPGEHFRS